MHEHELHIEEADIRRLIERMVQTGTPQTLDSLTEWYVEAVLDRIRSDE